MGNIKCVNVKKQRIPPGKRSRCFFIWERVCYQIKIRGGMATYLLTAKWNMVDNLAIDFPRDDCRNSDHHRNSRKTTDDTIKN